RNDESLMIDRFALHAQPNAGATSMKSFPVVLSALMACSAAGLGQPPTDPDKLPAQVKSLLAQMDSAPSEDRKLAAEWELLKLGPDVLPLLPPPDKRSENLKERLPSVQKALEALRAPTITMDKTQMPLSKALALVARETGMTVLDRRQGDRDQPVM